MINIKNKEALSNMLESTKETTKTELVRLANKTGSYFLLDTVVKKVMSNNQDEFNYKILDHHTSKEIMLQLHVMDNPTLLVIKNGQIKAILSGMISQHQLEDAIANLNSYQEQ